MDVLLDVDWVAHWRGLVEARDAESPRQDDFWDRRARRFALSTRGQVDPFLAFLEPWLGSTKTLIDVGAGVGRHALPLAARLDWVTAVEPSQGMRERIRPTDNMTVIASTWRDAEAAPADLVICVHVLYPIADVVPFLEKLERAATERVFVVLRDCRQPHPVELVADHLGISRTREPRLRDCFLLLRQLGITPDLAMFTYPVVHRFESREAVVEECRQRLGSHWDDATGRAWVEANMGQEEDGSFVHDGGEVTSGVLHWKPRN